MERTIGVVDFDLLGSLVLNVELAIHAKALTHLVGCKRCREFCIGELGESGILYLCRGHHGGTCSEK
ncbi:Uncharacterised protein [Chlamydia trachomatis]|nr:Uncharacterised protein [Chlamydia trachomatis]